MKQTTGEVVFEQIQLRSPHKVMRLARLGSSHQHRLSFMRTLLRLLKKENWQFKRSHWEMDQHGYGHAVYQAIGPEQTYSLVCFSNYLDAEERSDRVIASAWDTTFTLYRGVPTQHDIHRISQNVPKQELGRISDSELSLARANRSVRLWEHVVSRLAVGQQPDVDQIMQVGYLLRTTAVYGSGKFGACERAAVEGHHGLNGCFQPEMLVVYLSRWFSIDLVEHVAHSKGQHRAVTLEPHIKRLLGIGNSTGLGMAPFISNHPALIHTWINAREQAYLRVRHIVSASTHEKAQFRHFLKRAQRGAHDWYSEHELQQAKIKDLQRDMHKLLEFVSTDILERAFPWQKLYLWGEEHLTLEGQEQLLSLIIEPYGHVVDDLAQAMSVDEQLSFPIDASLTVGACRHIIECHYRWALEIDFSQRDSAHYVWYVSEEKLEPRFGERYDEDGNETGLSDYEQPTSIEWQVQSLYKILQTYPTEQMIADVLVQYPQYRHVVRRVVITNKKPYGEIQDSIIHKQTLPIDILRLKLSFFGAIKFDPRSKLWLRICLFQNAPFPEELAQMPFDDWIYPPEPQ